MRLEELILRTPGDEFRLRFHDRLTVLSGIGVLERRAFVDSLFSSLVGGPETTTLVYRDAEGRGVSMVSDRGRSDCAYEDGSAAPNILERIGKTISELRALMHLSASDLGLHGAAWAGEPMELAEARASLAALTEELHAAYSAKQAVEAMRSEVEAIEDRIRSSEENRARRQYARLLADLERVRAEAGALRTGRTGAEADRHLMASADKARKLASSWQEADRQATELRDSFPDDAERLDARTLQEAVGIPEQVPADIDALVAAQEDAEAERVALSVRLREMAASRLPEPSHPAVVDLARLDQDELWAAQARAIDTSGAVEAESVALGGLPAEGSEGRITGEIEFQHGEVLEAEQRVERTRRAGLFSGGGGVAAAAAAAAVAPIAAPVVLAGAAGAAGWMLLRPKRKLAKAQEKERRALEQAGASSYLAFHLRRVEAIIDPDARERLELVMLEHRMALAAWAELVPDLDPWTATALEDEVRGYAHSLRQLGGAAEEIEQVRAELVGRVEPTAEAARAALLEACLPFGIDDPFLASELVRHQVGVGQLARLQRALESAEAGAMSRRDEVDATLRNLGFADGELSARVGAFEWAYARASDRERSRHSARDVAEVEAELAKLEDEARRSRRPEWATVTASEADGPDLDELLMRRQATSAAYAAARNLVPDVDRLSDRHAALERRVAVLEQSLGAGVEADGPDTGAVRQYLLARLTQANGAGPDGDPLPVVIDEALVRLQGDAKWELLDLLDRVGERTQLVYLTDDPYVGAWSRRRAAAGAITLLEPSREAVG